MLISVCTGSQHPQDSGPPICLLFDYRMKCIKRLVMLRSCKSGVGAISNANRQSSRATHCTFSSHGALCALQSSDSAARVVMRKKRSPCFDCCMYCAGEGLCCLSHLTHLKDLSLDSLRYNSTIYNEFCGLSQLRWGRNEGRFTYSHAHQVFHVFHQGTSIVSTRFKVRWVSIALLPAFLSCASASM